MGKFNEKCLLLEAEGLSSWKRIAFMAYCAERMLPNYRRFSKETGFGDANMLRAALDSIWTWIETSDIPSDMASLVSACDEQAPNTENFDSIYTSAALDAASVIAETLEALSDPAINRLIEVASLARDSVYMFADWQQEDHRRDSKSGNEVVAHPLVQRELRTQRESVMFLRELDGDRRVAYSALQSQWLRQGHQGSLSASDFEANRQGGG